jgi:hypothetical protein
MPTFAQVTLDVYPGRRVAFVAEPRGIDEEALEGRSTIAAIRYLDSVLVDVPGTHVRRGDAAKLTARERDLLLAAVHELAFGPRIEGTVSCSACAARFELDFDLRAFAASIAARRGPTARGQSEQDGEAFFTTEGLRFRLPTGEDECIVLAVPAEERARALLERCVTGGTVEDAQSVIDAMSAVAPVLDDELDASCAECGALERVHFDIQSYHLGSIESGRDTLVYDVSRLASAYGWTLHDIASLARSRRRRYVAFLEGASLGGSSWATT